MAFPVHNDRTVEKFKASVLTGMRKVLTDQGYELLYGPRSETDDRFLLHIRTRYLTALVSDRDRLLRMGLAARRRAERLPPWGQSLEPARALSCSMVEEHRRAGTRGKR